MKLLQISLHLLAYPLIFELTQNRIPDCWAHIMKKIFFIALLVSLMSSSPAFAQQQEDEVVTFGTIRTDRAMSAFLAGDYEMAEIEFLKNARCALRATRNLEAGVESARDSTIRSEVTAGANTPPLPSGSPGGGPASVPSAPTSAPSASFKGNNFNKNESIAARTCDDRGFQLYMTGLSQIKLGKLEDAKKSFKSAIVLRKTIYDAHFRLALLEYQDGNIDNAKKQFKKLQRLEAKCKECESKEDMQGQVQYLKNLLG